MSAVDTMSGTSRVEQTHVHKLRAQGYTPKGKAQASYRGHRVEAVTFTKSENETFGKIPKVIAYGFLGVVGTVLTGCLLNISKSFREATWGKIGKIVSSNEPLGGMKTARLALGLACPFLLGFESFRDETWNPVVHGKTEKKVYFEKSQTPEEQDEEIARLGYDKTDADSVADYVKNLLDPKSESYNPGMVEDIEGDLVVREHRRPGISAVLVIPKGDYSKAMSVKFWKAKDGSPITNGADQYRTIRSILATRENIDEEWTKLAEKKAKLKLQRQMGELFDEENPVVQRQIKTEAKKIENGKRVIRLCPSQNCAYIKGKVELNDTSTLGSMVTLNKQSQKTLKDIHKMENKGNLQGTTRKTPPAPAPQEEFV